MSMLSLVQEFCARTNITVPVAVMGNTDTQVMQIKSLLNEVGNDMAVRGSWEGLTFEADFSTVALEDQGPMTTLAPNNFRNLKNKTIWDRTSVLPVCGPRDAADWQAMKANLVQGPLYTYRIRGGHMLVNPAPPAGNEWFFEYVSYNWILGADGTSYRQYFLLDTDTVLVPESVLLMGLRWTWKKEKGLEYAEDMRTYESQLKDSFGRDGSKSNLHMDNRPTRAPTPGIFVTPMSWPLP